MTYEVVPDREIKDAFRAEAINEEEGDAHVVIFSGQDAERRADEYAALMNNPDLSLNELRGVLGRRERTSPLPSKRR